MAVVDKQDMRELRTKSNFRGVIKQGKDKNMSLDKGGTHKKTNSLKVDRLSKYFTRGNKPIKAIDSKILAGSGNHKGPKSKNRRSNHLNYNSNQSNNKGQIRRIRGSLDGTINSNLINSTLGRKNLNDSITNRLKRGKKPKKQK